MGYRVTLLILIFLKLFLTFSDAATVDEKAIQVKIRSSGKSDLINVISLDLDDENKLLLNGISEEDSINYAFFQTHIFTDDYKKLSAFLSEINNKALKEKLIYDVLALAEKKGKLKEFKDAFISIIERNGFDKIKFILVFKENNLDNLKIKTPYLEALLDAYKFTKEGDYKSASEKIKPYSDKLPRTYYYFLINAHMYKEALEFISSSTLNNKNFFEALVYYYQGDCVKSLELLGNTQTSFSEKLLYIECKPAIEPYLLEGIHKDIARFFEDPFTFFIMFEKYAMEKQPEIIQPYQTFYYSFQLKKFLEGLSIYKDEIEKFVRKMNEVNKELKDILSKYESVWNEIEKSGSNKDIRRRVIDIEEKARGIKEVSFKSSFDSKKALSFLDEQIINTKSTLKSACLDFEKRQQKETAILNMEIEIRSFLNNLYSNQKLLKDDYEKILAELKKYYQLSVNDRLSIEEDIAYAVLYVLWDYSQNADLNQREMLWKELILEAKKYLNIYSERKKEVLLILAEALDGTSDYSSAIDTFQQYLSIDKNPEARTLMKVGELYFETGNYVKAIEFFKKAAEKSQSYKNAAYYKIGWSYYLLGKLSEVADLFLNYDFKEDSEKGVLLFDEMMELLSRVFFKLGEDKITTFLSKYPQFSIPEKLYKGVGDLHLFLADYDKALSVYEKGFNDYYLYRYSNELLAARVELYNLLGNSDAAFEEKYRFINFYGINSEYYKKFNFFPKEYKDFLYSTAIYYNVRFDRKNSEDDYKRSIQLYNKFINYFLDDERVGETAYLLAQLEEIKKNYSSSAEHFTLAWQKGFRVEDSLYRALYNQYKMWQNNKLAGSELINSLRNYVITYPNYDKTISAVIVLSDMLLKEGMENQLIQTLTFASESADEKKLIKILDFCETNLKQINDKKSLALLFNRGFEKLKDRRYLELKHYALFSEAKSREDAGNFSEAKDLYKVIIDDKDTTSFKEFALFNLALLLEKDGKVNEAVSAMQQIKYKQELTGKAKDFIYTFGKREGLYLEAAEAALELSKIDVTKNNFYYLEAVWLFLKGKDLKKAENTLNILSNLPKSEKEYTDYAVLKGIIENKKGKFIIAFDSFTFALKDEIKNEYDEEFIRSFHETLKNTIFLKPEDEARTAIESFIEFLSNRSKITGNPEYLYNIAEALSDFSVFFIQKEEAVGKAIEFYKRSLKLAVNLRNSSLVIKNIAKLKELQPEPYAKELEIKEPKVNFLEDITYEEVFTE